MINAYKIVLTNKEKNCLILKRSEIHILLKQANIKSKSLYKNYSYFPTSLIST